MGVALHSPSAPLPGFSPQRPQETLDRGQEPEHEWFSCEFKAVPTLRTDKSCSRVRESRGLGRAGAVSHADALGPLEAGEGTAHSFHGTVIHCSPQSRHVVTCVPQWAPYILTHPDFHPLLPGLHICELGKNHVGLRGGLELSERWGCLCKGH